MALKDLENGGNQMYYLNDFSRGQKGIKINGLIWMGEKQFMYEQLKRNYFGSINILLVHTVTFVGHWGCEQHHRNCTNTARDAGDVDNITRSAQIHLSCLSTGMLLIF